MAGELSHEKCGRCEYCQPIGDWCGLTEGSGARVVCWVYSITSEVEESKLFGLMGKCAYRKMGGVSRERDEKLERAQRVLGNLRCDLPITKEAASTSYDQRKQRLLGRVDMLKETIDELSAALGEEEKED